MWAWGVKTNIERVQLGVQMSLNQLGLMQKWSNETQDKNRIKLVDWPDNKTSRLGG